MSHYSASIHTTTVEILDDGALDAATLPAPATAAWNGCKPASSMA